MNTLSNMVKQFLDNVNAGKFVTDIGPGLAFTVPLLMLVAVLTDSELVPAQQAPHLRREYHAAHREIEREVGVLSAILKADPLASNSYSDGAAAKAATIEDKNDLTITLPLPYHWERAERDAASSLLAIAAKLTTTQRSLNREAKAEDFTRAERLVANQKQIDHLLASIKAQREQLGLIRKSYSEATTITKNLEIWETNIALVAGLAVVLGVIVSQASRLIFFEGLFRFKLYSGLKPNPPPPPPPPTPPPPPPPSPSQSNDPVEQRAKTAMLKQLSPATAAAYQDLVTNHLRYAEGAVNMAAPVFLFAVVYPLFAKTLVKYDVSKTGASDPLWVTAWCLLVFLCLIGSGWITYRRFRQKEREWIEHNVEALAIAASTTEIIKKERATTSTAESAQKAADAAKVSADAAKKEADKITAVAADVAAIKKFWNIP